MQFDLTVTISVILALSAIISPIIVTIINNRYQLKVKQMEINEKYVISTFQNYLSKLELCISINYGEIYNDYQYAYGQALLYASHRSKVLMKGIDELIKSSEQRNLTSVITSEMIFELSDSLQDDIRRIKK